MAAIDAGSKLGTATKLRVGERLQSQISMCSVQHSVILWKQMELLCLFPAPKSRNCPTSFAQLRVSRQFTPYSWCHHSLDSWLQLPYWTLPSTGQWIIRGATFGAAGATSTNSTQTYSLCCCLVWTGPWGNWRSCEAARRGRAHQSPQNEIQQSGNLSWSSFWKLPFSCCLVCTATNIVPI